MSRFFIVPALVSLGVLGLVFWWSGFSAFFTVAVLSLLEIALSFDNAVVNAKVLKRMSPLWRKRFLTWGIAIAVVGTRLVLPVLIVSVTAWASPLIVAKLAVADGRAYGDLIGEARYAIAAFGGAFLSMVSLRYFLDREKTVHWIHGVERRLSALGDIEALEIVITLILLSALAFFADPSVRAPIIVAGIIGVGLSVVIESAMHVLSLSGEHTAAHGIGLFVYLNILDSAFSLDGVVGAFALTTLIPLIVVGLGIGAYFVRLLTVYMTERGTLDSLVFIEHGAYWAIFGLALSMFASLIVPVPEFVAGSIGLLCIFAAYVSSVRTRRIS